MKKTVLFLIKFYSYSSFFVFFLLLFLLKDMRCDTVEKNLMTTFI